MHTFGSWRTAPVWCRLPDNTNVGKCANGDVERKRCDKQSTIEVYKLSLYILYPLLIGFYLLGNHLFSTDTSILKLLLTLYRTVAPMRSPIFERSYTE